ncbi:transglutaminase family protein [Alkalihalobacillus sp. AL-G]|uniref:transglutaminase family protein n=1 Tax=Alkalihalobacillus sp. AL-G TaxID=2926399 RepID=UPI00272DB901|nr:transglutaminase family protein [Alkalihalobacillus sp. AL-G]WLD93133.1 transglutaminase family protein [Alkalihalobacillus sp. AL-G]
MKYRITQHTHYSYEQPVSQSINQIRLKPIDDMKQECLCFQKEIKPDVPSYVHYDYWGNHVETFYAWEDHDQLLITTTSEVIIDPLTFVSSLSFSPQMLEAFCSAGFQQRYAEFLTKTYYTTLDDVACERLTSPLWDQAANPFEYVKLVNEYIYETFTYKPGSTTVQTTAAEILEKKEGVCQDYTNLMLALCRYRGIPARYVSGYLYIGENSAMRGDAATHAWVEVKMPSAGWIGFDPTNNVLAKDQHIRVAVGRDYADIVPLKGVYQGGVQHLDVKVSVSAIEENVNA